MGMGIQYGCIPSLKLTVRHGKSTILMVFTRKHGDFHGLLLLVSGRVYIYICQSPFVSKLHNLAWVVTKTHEFGDHERHSV